MATLENIRKRSGLLIITIGLAMAAFIMMDLLGSGDSLLRGDVNAVGKINGHKIELAEFNRRIENMEQNYKEQSGDYSMENVTRKQIVDAVWMEYIRKYALYTDLNKIGIKVSDDELYVRVKNNPNIQQADAFKDRLTGRFSESALQDYITQLEDRRNENQETYKFWRQWVDFEKEIYQNALTQKYQSAIGLAIHTPIALARHEQMRISQSLQGQLVPILYSAIEDSLVSITEKDIKRYYDNNRNDFLLDKPYRNFEFVNFPINPSEEDEQSVYEDLMAFMEPEIRFNEQTGENDTIPAFADAKDDSAYVSMRTDGRWDKTYHKESNSFHPEFDSIVFYGEVGTVFGPYTDEDGYVKLSKVSDVKMLPDSVDARHILISFQGAERSTAERQPMEAKELADSIFAIIKEDPSKFDDYISLSDDPTAEQNDGALGWFDDQTMAGQFTDFSFHNSVGDVGLVLTDFGFHIIEILDQKGSTKGVQVATIVRDLQPTEATFNKIYARAQRVASAAGDAERFEQAAREEGAQVRPVSNIKRFDEMILGLGNNREIVRWVWDEKRKEGDIHLLSNENKSFVIVHVTDIVDGKYKPLSAVRQEVEDRAFDEKKADYIRKKLDELMKTEADINAIAQAFNTTVSDLNINYGQSSIGRAGNEPKVIGALFGLSAEAEKPSVIKGDKGIYVVKVKSLHTGEDTGDYAASQEEITQAIRNNIVNFMLDSKEKKSKVKDNRHNFF